jgi:phosphoribosylglycinamide formyltransferase-1
MRLGVLVSHEGTTLQAILDACGRGDIECRVAVVISNNRELGALARAAAAGVPAYHLSSRIHPDPDALAAAIRDTLVRHDVEVVVLAGYMKKIGL